MAKLTPEMRLNVRKIKTQLPRGYAALLYEKLNRKYSKNYIYSVANGNDWNRQIFDAMIALKQIHQKEKEDLAALIKNNV